MKRLLPLLLVAATNLSAQPWSQWGGTADHHSSTPAIGRYLGRIEAEIVLDPNAEAMEAQAAGNLLAHYPVPIVDGDDVFVVKKSGPFTSAQTRETQTWNVVAMRRANGVLADQWTYPTDWKPVPFGSASWEPVYHPAITADALFAPGAGGTIDKIRRSDGTRIARYNPFGAIVDATIFVTGPPAIDAAGNVYYNAMQFTASTPWANDPPNSWLVRVAADGTITKATFTSLTPNAPRANDQCRTTFAADITPWPPSRDAVAPSARCGAQRPGMNVAPAIAPDGTVYTISRAHLNDRWGYLVAANANLTPKWAASLRNRFHDGCGVSLPSNGTLGGCRDGSNSGVDPADNESGSGRVNDNATSSPVVAPDGNILYGSYTRYNYSQGHLMMFGPTGNFINSYGWGWDLTPAIYPHDGTYSIVLKENHYSTGSYCNDVWCPNDRTLNTPWDPEWYFITQLNAALEPEWKFQSRNTQSCVRRPDGSVLCFDTNPHGFEWCVNAVAVDSRGTVYATSEDGNLYAIGQGGFEAGRIFLRLALGAAYTPTSIGSDGRIYTQNDGNLFIIDETPRRRVVKR